MGVVDKLGGLAESAGSITGSTISMLGGPGGVAIEAGMKLLTAAIGKLVKELGEMNEISERLAVINTNLENELVENTESLEKNTVGFGLAIKALAELRVAGFEKTNANLINLATRTKISGQNTGAVIKLGQDIIAAGSHQEGVMDRLAKDIVDNSLKYGTTTDSMIQAMGKLSENLQVLSVMGGTETAGSLTAELTARLGQENSALVGRLMKELTSVNGNLNMQAIMGMERTGDRINMGMISNAQAIDDIIRGGQMAAAVQGSAAQTGRRAMQATFGAANQFVMDLRVAGDKLQTAQKPVLGMWDKLSKTITVMKEVILDPLRSIAIGLLKPFQMLIGGIATLVAGFLNLVIRAFGPVIAIIFDVVGLVAGFIGTIFNGVAYLFEGLYDLISMIPGVGRYFRDSDSETNSTLNSINKMLESIGATDREALGIASDEARKKEKERIGKMDPLKTGMDIYTRAALLEIDKRARTVGEVQSRAIAESLTDFLEKNKSAPDYTAGIQMIVRAIIGSREPVF
jgi:hypothetical protein